MQKVSICIPAYNHTYYLKKNLISILSQTFTDYEVIITDDSTNTEVKELINEFDFNGKLRYYHNESPLGAPQNWNYCISKASGDYIKIMHHDDWFSSNNSLQSMVDLLESSPECEFVFCGCNNISIDGENMLYHRINEEQVAALNSHPELLFKSNVIGGPSVTLFKKNNEVKFDEKIKYLVDIEFYIHLLKGDKKFACTVEPLINIGGSPSQVTYSIINDKRKLIYEYSYTYQKLEHSKSTFNFYFETFWQLIARINISSVSELVELGWQGEVPLFVAHCIYGNNLFKFLKKVKGSRLIKPVFYFYSIKRSYGKSNFRKRRG
jgi:glycosyltransferase involved in cell wall biosynthesis